MRSELVWNEGLRFIGVTESKHSVVIDAKKEFGGFESAPSPMELLSIALMGCTAMDVISILKKMKEEEQLDEFRIFFEGERSNEHPKIFTKIKLIYQFKGKNLKYDNIKKAVELSQEKYCSVSHMLKKSTNIEYEIKIINSEA
ncbi:MAG: OsmC family protein [Candidatus Calescibacterium sp.]|nr:OsmC family protein [Candidatus Calescibacterium sp.]MCX7972375.1 OsmC family protein [bacterium]MDW8195734.1 OsmC family protein [Candidatus Calescibacterium sp.]